MSQNYNLAKCSGSQWVKQTLKNAINDKQYNELSISTIHVHVEKCFSPNLRNNFIKATNIPYKEMRLENISERVQVTSQVH